MRTTSPKVFLVAETVVDRVGLHDYLEHIGATDWFTDAPSEGELLVEVMGRLCYRSFEPGLNPNVKKIREGNEDYIKNIKASAHGSVMEHANVSFIFTGVSRVFTHELVRHRMGVAISQESLRFVRLTELDFWVPSAIRENEQAMEIFEEAIADAEHHQASLTRALLSDDMAFSDKKLITSAMRRVAPMGLATSIGWTCNFRALRWIIELRTHPAAEEEIRKVFDEVAEIVTTRYPNAFGDFDRMSDGSWIPIPGQNKI